MVGLERRLLEVLARHMSAIVARSTLQLSASRCHVDLHSLRPGDREPLAAQIINACHIFVQSRSDRTALQSELCTVLELADEGRLTRESACIRVEQAFDVMLARDTGRDFSAALGFSLGYQNRVATAISELARNIVQYAGCGEITLRRLPNDRSGIEIRAVDRGPGIPHLESVLSGTYRSKTGMGMGLLGTKRLMDEFEIDTQPGKGTAITLRKYV